MKFSAMYLLIPLICLCGCASAPNKTKNDIEPQITQAVYTDPMPDYINMAQELVEMGHYKLALANLDKAPKNMEKNPAYFFLMGECNLYLGNYKLAEKFYRKTLHVNDSYAQAYNGLGFVYGHTNRNQAKIDAFEKAVACNPGRADFLNNLGYAYFEDDNFDKAIMCFKRSIELSPDFTMAYINLGYALGMDERYDESLNTFLRVLPADQALNNLGVLYEQTGNPQKALVMYRKALDENPDLHEAQANLSRLNNMGD